MSEHAANGGASIFDNDSEDSFKLDDDSHHFRKNLTPNIDDENPYVKEIRDQSQSKTSVKKQ